MPLGGFRFPFRREFEQRHIAHDHRFTNPGRQVTDPITPFHPEMGIHAIEGTCPEFIHYLQAGNDLTPVRDDLLYQIPFGAVVDERRILAHIPERRHETVPAVSQTLHKRLRADVIIPDGELVGPALQGIFHIAVNHHVFRKVAEVHPVCGVACQGLLYIVIQDLHALFHFFAQIPGNPVDVGPADAGEKRSGERKESSRHESDGNPMPYDSFLIHGDTALP